MLPNKCLLTGTLASQRKVVVWMDKTCIDDTIFPLTKKPSLALLFLQLGQYKSLQALFISKNSNVEVCASEKEIVYYDDLPIQQFVSKHYENR